MRKALVLSTLIAILPAVGRCAEIIRHPGVQEDKSEYGPVKNHVTTGLVRYENSGRSRMWGRARDHAYKLMYNECNGSYEIMNEANGTEIESVSTPTGVLPVLPGDSVSSDVDSYKIVTIEFACVEKSTETAVGVSTGTR